MLGQNDEREATATTLESIVSSQTIVLELSSNVHRRKLELLPITHLARECSSQIKQLW